MRKYRNAAVFIITVVFMLLFMVFVWNHHAIQVFRKPFLWTTEVPASGIMKKEKIDFQFRLKDNRPPSYLPRMKYKMPSALKQLRTDVNVMTPWFAPIVWDGTYNYEILNEQFKQGNYSTGVIIFAVKKYTRFLEEFLTTAELYFMLGHYVHYYIFTDRPKDIPNINLKTNRFLHIIRSETYERWQDILFNRMKNIQILIEEYLSKEVDYLVSTDVDMKFDEHIGIEVLGNLAATIHPGYYSSDRTDFPYERRQTSEAYIPMDEGDFYYSAAFYAGTVQEMYLLAKTCAEAIEKDKEKGIEAVWHEESHFNKYLLYYKPTKVLSPEYTWNYPVENLQVVKKKRFITVPKNNEEVRY
ncbi:histo-blood group ABO system transferase-like [Protopterus annectens]|uniref:histo-blood group ABO system transferase-like n=1 Tax=Protopterus annectens TaxID=7888 RepID=UPI001CFAFD3D|nr:histo-blood group ABO system transferase-like [Protopterus annectens]